MKCDLHQPAAVRRARRSFCVKRNLYEAFPYRIGVPRVLLVIGFGDARLARRG